MKRLYSLMEKRKQKRLFRLQKSLFSGQGNAEDIPTSSIALNRLKEGIDIFTVFQEANLCKSKGEARRLLKQGGVYVNDEQVKGDHFILTNKEVNGDRILLRAGKKRYHRLVVE